jgi:WD40 repeat protein
MHTPRLAFGLAAAGSLLFACQRPGLRPANVVVMPELVATWPGHTAPVHSLDLSPDGAAVLSASDDMTLRIWRVATGETATVLRGHGDKVWGALFLPDGREVVSAGFDASVKRWDVARDVEVHSMSLDPTVHGFVCIARSADGRRIATGGFDSIVRLWDVGANTPRATCQGHSDTVWAVAFAPDGEHVYSGSFDGSIRVWHVTSGACVAKWTEADPEGRGWKRAFAIAPDGRTLSCAGADRPREWDLATGAQLPPFQLDVPNSTVAITVSRDGRWLATGGFDRHLAIWDRTSRTLVARWPAEQGEAVWAVLFLPDGHLLSAGDSGTIKQWRLAR